VTNCFPADGAGVRGVHDFSLVVGDSVLLELSPDVGLVADFADYPFSFLRLFDRSCLLLVHTGVI
jgi:hypothetical protein